MDVVAYCRVSTDKEDQLNSFDAQQEFFKEYTKTNNMNLIKIYADEGISGTKTKNRLAFNQMMKDSELKRFQLVLVKDISRFARNTVDLLQNVRKLKSLNIEMRFITANMTTLGESEFLLTVFGAIAQEESGSLSKRVKFGKKINAKKGRVPNFIYGYNKIKGNYYDLEINDKEAEIVNRIFKIYAEDGIGTTKIFEILNSEGITTSRGSKWFQASVRAVLKNPIYIGKVINGREEVKDFLTGERVKKDESEWSVTNNPNLRIVSDEIFEKANNILSERTKRFHTQNTRYSCAYPFSTLIKCSECGYSFARTSHEYKVGYKWVCSHRNIYGKDSCSNRTLVIESELENEIKKYLTTMLKNKDKYISDTINDYNFKQEQNLSNNNKDDIKKSIDKNNKIKQKYMDMYTDDLISREELNIKLTKINNDNQEMDKKIKQLEMDITPVEKIKSNIQNMFDNIEQAVASDEFTNPMLKSIFENIIVYPDKKIILKLLDLSK